MRLLPRLEAALRMKKVLILMICLLCCFAMPALAEEMSISGYAYVDMNGNTLCDSGETLMSGVPVTLEREGEEPVQTVTNEYGQYVFEGLSAGEYRLLSAVGDETLYAASIGNTAINCIHCRNTLGMERSSGFSS